jgi:uncharacterized protein (DUF779 family)
LSAAVLALLACAAIDARANAGEAVMGGGGLITHDEALKVVKRYRSIPGDGVKGHGGLMSVDDAHKVFKRYRSIPGDGVKGHGGMMSRDDAHKVFKRYKSIPGDGVKGHGGMMSLDDAHKVFKRYRSIPGDGVKGHGGMMSVDDAHKVFKRYRSIPGDGVKGHGGMMSLDDAHKVLKRYRSIPGDGVKGHGGMMSPDDAHKVLKRYRSIPGGVVLEGKAAGVPKIKSVEYEAATNTFVIDSGRAVYVSPLPPEKAALLARALAKDDRIGVSIGEDSHIVFGKLPQSSDLAADLMMVDNFLGDIVLPPQAWTFGYKFANGFEPAQGTSDNAAVFFRFKDFAFQVSESRLQLANAQFDARVVPVLDREAADGGYLPDYKAIASPARFERYEAGARHVADNIGYYLGEEIVRRTLGYGEVAALFRSFKASGINLEKLARKIETTLDKPAARRTAGRTLEASWQDYLKEIQAANRYANWSAPPYDLYLSSHKPATQ